MATGIAPAVAPPAGGAPQGQTVNSARYAPHLKAAVGLLIAAGAVAIGTVLAQVHFHSLPYWPGSAAAAVGILIILALLLAFPALILDDSPENGGQPSTMRILSLVIVFTFCILVLFTAWNTRSFPQPSQEWIWLIGAALGGKAAQAYAEMKGKT